MEIYPSLISSNLLYLARTIEELDPHCHGYHIDVMDDHFVPNLTWGPMFVETIVKTTKRPLHVHLMVDNPKKWLDRMPLRKNDVFIFHHEAIENEKHICDIIKDIKKMNCLVGVAINPPTPIQNIFSYVSLLDHVLVMSVTPGFSGQAFMPEVVKKIPLLVQEKKENKLKFSIGMDGGIGVSSLPLLVQAGVEQVGIASAIFSQPDPVAALKNLYKVA